MAARRARTIILALTLASVADCSLAFETSDLDQGCGPGMKRCSDTCVPLMDPAWGCGATTCVTCGYDNAIAACDQDGRCTFKECLKGFAGCQGRGPCDTNTFVDRKYCGDCATACPDGQWCVVGECKDPIVNP